MKCLTKFANGFAMIKKIIRDAVSDLRYKIKTEKKGNWFSNTVVTLLIIIFLLQFLIFEPLVAGLIAFTLTIIVHYLLLVINKDAKNKP